jgi:hypothetical protein
LPNTLCQASANLPVLLQIGGQYEVAAAQSAKVTGDDPTLALGTSQLVFLAGNVLQVSRE